MHFCLNLIHKSSSNSRLVFIQYLCTVNLLKGIAVLYVWKATTFQSTRGDENYGTIQRKFFGEDDNLSFNGISRSLPIRNTSMVYDRAIHRLHNRDSTTWINDSNYIRWAVCIHSVGCIQSSCSKEEAQRKHLQLGWIESCL